MPERYQANTGQNLIEVLRSIGDDRRACFHSLLLTEEHELRISKVARTTSPDPKTKAVEFHVIFISW
ncbi:hypothetical protein DXT94_05215 [Rhizobium sp. ICMP 5592]|nr:hypothetical protein [Rhizobium sp. ICMP 5592]